MKCFNHREKEAIGTCKNCYKALCEDCYSEVEGSLACKNQCEETVKKMNNLINTNIKQTNSLYSQVGSVRLLNTVSAIIVFTYGWWYRHTLYGVLMCLVGLFIAYRELKDIIVDLKDKKKGAPKAD